MIEITPSPRPGTPEEEARAIAGEMRAALTRIADALRLPGSPILAAAVPEAVERLVAERTEQAALIERLQLAAAGIDTVPETAREIFERLSTLSVDELTDIMDDPSAPPVHRSVAHKVVARRLAQPGRLPDPLVEDLRLELRNMRAAAEDHEGRLKALEAEGRGLGVHRPLCAICGHPLIDGHAIDELAGRFSAHALCVANARVCLGAEVER